MPESTGRQTPPLFRGLFHNFDGFFFEYKSRLENVYGFLRPVILNVVELTGIEPETC
jgi:hypothetical protein